jgi:hypothetical protein
VRVALDPVLAHPLDPALEVGIADHHGAAFTGGDVLDRVEAEHHGVAGAGPDEASAIARAQGVAGVLHDPQTAPPREVGQLVDVGGQAAEVDRHDGARARGDQRLDRLGRQVAGSGVDVRDPDAGADIVCRRGGRRERQRRGDDLVALADAERRVDQVQRGGTARAHAGMRRAEPGRQRGLEARDQRTAGELR